MAPRMTKGVRERIWRVMIEWHELLPPDGGVVMTFPDNSSPGGQEILILGSPKMELVEVDGFWLTRTIENHTNADGDTPAEGTPTSL